jgi:hypothetical protein
VRARIHDATGPRWTRLVLPAIGALGMVAGLFRWRADGAPLGPDFFVGFALFIVAPLLLGRHSPRAVELVAVPGRLLVRRAGLLTQTIHARDLNGGSTTSSAGGVTLAIGRANRDAPTLLELTRDEDLKAVRDALGIGHHGFGSLSFPTAPRVVDRLRATLRICAAAAAFLIGLCIVLSIEAAPLVTLATFFLIFPFPFAHFWTWVRARETRHDGRVWLTPEDVVLQGGRGGWEHVRYADIASARVEDGWLVLERRDSKPVCTRVTLVRHARHGATRVEIAHILAQIEDAGRRARGEFVPEPAIGGAATLARQENEPARSWLERVEATARQLSGSYRGAALSAAELWAALENHDADPSVRAASARVLVRVAPPEALARVESVLAAVRDDLVRAKMRVAVEPDLEHACDELEQLEVRR